MSRSTFLPDAPELAQLLTRAGVGVRHREAVVARWSSGSLDQSERPTRPRFAAICDDERGRPVTNDEVLEPLPDMYGAMSDRAKRALEWLGRATGATKLFLADEYGLPLASRNVPDPWLAYVAALAQARADIARLGGHQVACFSLYVEMEKMSVVWQTTTAGLITAGWVGAWGIGGVSLPLNERITEMLHQVASGLTLAENTKGPSSWPLA